MLTDVSLYDAASNTWEQLAPLTESRSNHTATLLADGRVLIVGGGRANAVGLPAGLDVRASAILYDPSTRSMSPVGSPLVARHFHRAVVLPSGNVLLVGGAGNESKVLPAQGSQNPQPFGNAIAQNEVFDVAARTFRAAGALAEARYSFSAVALSDGRVLVSGGASYAGDVARSFATSELYDERTDAFGPTGSFDGSDRLFHDATRLTDGRVLVFGGKKSNTTFLADTQLYDPASGTFSMAGEALPKRTAPRVIGTSDGGALLIAGYSCTFSCAATSNVSSWQPSAITPGPDLSTPRGNATATVLPDGSVLVLGGFDSFELDAAERLVP